MVFTGNLRKIPFKLLWGLIAVLASGSLLDRASAGAPEYLQLRAEPGMALEIAGAWDSKGGVFISDDIEILPKERLPKLRGEIQEVDRDDSTITIYGRAVKIYERTEFIDDGAGHAGFESLKKGMRIEVSCKFDEDGSWKARKIKTKDVKESNKIKGTVTRVAIDGAAPDTIEISGLLILLIDQTDVVEPSGSLQQMEKELFPDIRLSDKNYPTEGRLIRPGLLLGADYRQSVVSENDYDLSQFFESNHQETEPAVRFELTAFFSDKLQAFAQVRMRKKYFISSERLYPPSKELDADISQLYFLARNFGIRGLAAEVGRQDFEEDREWLYDDYLDAIRVFYYGAHPLAFETAYIHAVSPMKDKFKTWTDILFQAHLYPNKDNHISSYIIMRSDTAIRNREPQWYGIRYKGEIGNLATPWFEFSYMAGEDKGRTLKAHALDLGTTLKAEKARLRPSLTVAYAVGSGDKISGDDSDNRFRQTGYEDNVDYFGGVASIHYYSEVIDPELSNIEIATIGLGVMPIDRGSIELVYHKFKQNKPKDEITGGDLVDPPARPNGISDDLGSEIDVVLGMDKLWNHLSLSWTMGFFTPGEAFDPYLENAMLNRFNLKLEL